MTRNLSEHEHRLLDERKRLIAINFARGMSHDELQRFIAIGDELLALHKKAIAPRVLWPEAGG